MEFLTVSTEKRPIRLNKSTRKWAYESQRGKYGDEILKTPFVSLDDIEGFEDLSSVQKYDVAIRAIAKNAPIRICPEEKICASATLGDALGHIVPAKYNNEKLFMSVSHITVRFDKVINEGLDCYSKEIEERLKDTDISASQTEFLKSLQNVIESIRIWHARYLDATKDTRPDLYNLLCQVPFRPARSFLEAVQSLWFVFAFLRLCGNWSGIGRIDWLLGDYLKNDIEKGVIDIDGAREILASFFIKGCEWILSDTPVGSGDAQHYQNIVLAGIDEDGREITNDVTFLVLDIVEELGISDFPITVRINKNTPPALKQKTAEVIRHGGGVVAVYNEELILDSLKSVGYPEREARMFANDGCWEVQIPGKTDFIYLPFDALQIFNKIIGLGDEPLPDYTSISQVYDAFIKELEQTINKFYHSSVQKVYVEQNGAWSAVKQVTPTSVISLFEDGCIENARSYYDFGPKYVVRSPHIGGAPDVANSLYAIQKLVFEQNKVSLAELVDIVKNNWQDNELLRLYVKNKYVYYGNDSDEVDGWHSRLLNDFADLVSACNKKSDCPVKFIAGVSTFGRQIEWLPQRCATVFGYKKGEILSGNDSPVPGTDTLGATSIIKSYCKTDLKRQVCGAALDVKIFPESLCGDNGIQALISLIDGFVSLGGYFMQIDAVDTATLLAAQKDPQKYKTLSVRVSGWNARFVTLDKEWQNMIIGRSAQGIN